jgi:glutamate dehydrogenase (NAD(P)+)
MEDAFRFADEIGPLKLVHIHRAAIGLKAVVAIDNVACGPAIGGVRMAPDVSTEEAFRLARAMTFKNAAAGLPHGGGKSVIFADPKMPLRDKERLIRAFAGAIADLKEYIPGPDMGTNELALGWIKDETGRAVGLPREIGGIPLDEIGATGYGLVAAIDVAREHIGLPLAGARIVVQGSRWENTPLVSSPRKGPCLSLPATQAARSLTQTGLISPPSLRSRTQDGHCTTTHTVASSAWTQ